MAVFGCVAAVCAAVCGFCGVTVVAGLVCGGV